jgi:hypothetical protein
MKERTGTEIKTTIIHVVQYLSIMDFLRGPYIAY